MTRPTVSCIVPAYNEAARIGAVLAAVCGHALVDEVIVVDDASTDATADVAAAHGGARVLRQDRNGGKTLALYRGLTEARGDLVLLLDADLTGLTGEHVARLIGPVASGRAGMAISLRGNAPGLWRAIGLDYISGERVMPRDFLAPLLAELPRLPRFGFEVWLNSLLVAGQLPLAVVPWPEVASPWKHSKRGLRQGLIADLRMVQDMTRTIPAHRLLAQIVAMRRMRVG